MAMKKALTRKLGMEYYSYDRGSESEYEDEELPPKEELEYLELIQKTKESISLLPSLNS
ncbi:hypothetical protein Bca4012_087819 [Brassica carinata]|uniref:Uncharacterized protein n=1 Tax=Brassica carinata TaxID=52824 RepID=A0A8X7PCK0_BRACI|nr:hypothetical protein Bca52824_088473 [Brassica carinata]